MSETLSRNARLVKYFAQVCLGIPRKHLVKFVYESDVLAREYLGRPISTLRYHRDKYGPYDPAIEDAVAELLATGHVEQRRDPWYRGSILGGAYLRLFDQHRPIAFGFDLGESAVLDYVVSNYAKMPFDEFMRDVIYETAPWRAAPRMGEQLAMDLCDNAGTRLVGFRLAEILAAEEAGRRGEVVTLSAFVDELRSQAPA